MHFYQSFFKSLVAKVAPLLPLISILAIVIAITIIVALNANQFGKVGLQNSGLATALCIQFFSPISAIPSAIFSIWHNLSGAMLAGYWASLAHKKR